ncbi:hypothetical protein BWQ96_03419 [Gracilariopsis chorda]|uniref:Uncharacterized protein n=1 Tax=Gracilariopsis chorda TaxID=448386 RepID=A0A2V3J0J8_9FLOR|nr:hypothetical protein BWQ96_03419 [Gracilariopsis chorda]|eukprot:PXF46890.1 hypothetical protein BWQ96_03419 [Gracilariopsis chorda]
MADDGFAEVDSLFLVEQGSSFDAVELFVEAGKKEEVLCYMRLVVHEELKSERSWLTDVEQEDLLRNSLAEAIAQSGEEVGSAPEVATVAIVVLLGDNAADVAGVAVVEGMVKVAIVVRNQNLVVSATASSSSDYQRGRSGGRRKSFPQKIVALRTRRKMSGEVKIAPYLALSNEE